MIRVGKYEIPTQPGRRAMLEVDSIPGFSVAWTGDAVRVTLGAVSALSAVYSPSQTPQDKFVSALDLAIKRVDAARSAAFKALRLMESTPRQDGKKTESDATLATLTKVLPKKPTKAPQKATKAAPAKKPAAKMKR